MAMIQGVDQTEIIHVLNRYAHLYFQARKLHKRYQLIFYRFEHLFEGVYPEISMHYYFNYFENGLAHNLEKSHRKLSPDCAIGQGFIEQANLTQLEQRICSEFEPIIHEIIDFNLDKQKKLSSFKAFDPVDFVPTQHGRRREFSTEVLAQVPDLSEELLNKSQINPMTQMATARNPFSKPVTMKDYEAYLQQLKIENYFNAYSTNDPLTKTKPKKKQPKQPSRPSAPWRCE